MTESHPHEPSSHASSSPESDHAGPDAALPAPDLQGFLDAASSGGTAVAVTTATELPDLGPSVRVRTVSGTTATTLGGLYSSFARVWGFPDHFGRNKDAFDDCMRDLDTPDTQGRAPGIVVVHITQAHRLLDDDRPGFDWFADSVGFYRDHYRDAGHGFAVILSTSTSRLAEVRSRWQRAGVAITDLVTETSTGEND
ncbi:barstar family protein [Gordonia paraffinivorans]|uniref:barstar family protein n=1 Tax=Gordonia paraffinivorans TaxID=175628 RepID=UPI001444C2B7|nr:barstar family protein [Gordonia paraffinivorans]